MKIISGSGRLPVLVTAAGACALVLRRQLYLTAVDEKGLLQRLHPLSIALLVLTAAALVLIYLTVRREEESPEEACCRPSPLAALGHLAMAGGILLTVLGGMPRAAGYLSVVWQYLGYAAPLCLAAAAVDRLRGKKPFFLLHLVPSLFLAVHIVGRYQVWSGNPQMQDYVFALLGAMGLMFFSFYTAALEAGCGSRRMRLGMGLAAACLCMAELGHSGAPMLYLAGAVWVLTDLGCRKLREE